MHALIDADSLLYKAGFVCNGPGEESLAKWQLDGVIQGVLSDAQPTSYELFITGSDNFRNRVYNKYKANRKDMQRPLHLEALRHHIVDAWGARVSYGNEADDEVGIAQMKAEDETYIAHIDKDINMIPGTHYNFVKKEFYHVSNEEAWINFLWQILLGDRVDNIPGYDGKMRAQFPKFMQHIVDDVYDGLEQGFTEGLVAALQHHQLDEWPRLLHCLWIQRGEEDEWLNHVNKSLLSEATTMVCGPKDVSMLSLQALCEQPQVGGAPSIDV